MSAKFDIRILAARYPTGKQALDSAPIAHYLNGGNRRGHSMPRGLLDLLVCGLVAASLAGCGEPQHVPGKPYHHTDSGFRNPPGSPTRNSWIARAPWVAKRMAGVVFSAQAAAARDHVLPRDMVLRQLALAEEQNTVTWIGHMTTLLRLDRDLLETPARLRERRRIAPDLSKKLVEGLAHLDRDVAIGVGAARVRADVDQLLGLRVRRDDPQQRAPRLDVMLVADVVRHTRDRIQQIDGGIVATAGEPAREREVPVEHAARGGLELDLDSDPVALERDAELGRAAPLEQGQQRGRQTLARALREHGRGRASLGRLVLAEGEWGGAPHLVARRHGECGSGRGHPREHAAPPGRSVGYAEDALAGDALGQLHRHHLARGLGARVHYAVLDGDEWLLNGEKIFVTTGCRAEGVVVWATIDKSAGRAGIKSFVVLKDTPGFVVAHKEKKLGIRADDTAAYVFQDCRIPRENLLGLDETIPKQSSGGFRKVMKTFNMTRPGVAAIGLGMAEAALDFTREQLRESGIEVHYGPGLHGQSAAAEKFLRLEATYEAAMLTVLRAAWLADQGQPNNLEASVCKAKAGAAVREITQGCVEILGPMGVSREYLLEKWFRDVRITDIYEGTGQIQRLIIARNLLGYTRKELK